MNAAEKIEYNETTSKKEFKPSWMKEKKELWKKKRKDEKETWNLLTKADLKDETEVILCAGLQQAI